MAPTRKYPSGASKIRKTRRIEKLKNSQKGAMHQFLTKKPQNLAIEDAADASQEQSPDEELNDVEEDVEQVVEEAAEEAEEPIEEPVENPVEEPVEEAAEEPVEVEDAEEPVELVSKDLQSEEMLIDVAMDNVKGLISFFEEYRQNGFQKAVTCAKEIAAEMEIDVVFHEKKKKIRRKKQFFDEVRSESSEPTLSAEESFRIEYFVYIVDQTIGSLKRRFEEYEQYENIFGFLFTAERLNSLDENELKTSCNNLQQKLQHDQVSDVDSEDLFHELQLLQKHLPNEKNTAIAILNFLKRTNCYPSVCLAYRILLTVPVTVASAERSFSKLKLLKTYLRSTMTQDRLNALAMISIESEFLEKLDYERLIDDFAAKNARRSIFIK